MSDPVIRVENLGKKYRLRHQGDRQQYVALRDVITDKVKGLFRPRKTAASRNTVEDFWALKNVSFEVKQGEVVGIIGRNGAGKSTLLKILSRITEPAAGKVTLNGRVASLLEVGTGFHPELTGRENIFLNGAILGMSRVEIKRKFDEIVAFAQVEKFLDTPVKRYSSGMYVRLAFAVAAHLEPEILIVDEVLAVGDAQFQKKCLGKMQEVSKAGRTVLFVSHNMPMVESLSDRIIWMDRGSVKEDGQTDKVIPSYLRQGALDSTAGDLRNHPGRRNSREPALIRVWLETAERQRVDSVVMGQPMYFCFEFNCPVPVANPIFGFGIEDSMGRRVFSLNNLMTGPHAGIPTQITKGIARLSLPNNPLLPGTYYLSINIVENLHVWVDFVEQAMTFTVEPTDIYGTGQIPQPSHGAVYINGVISVEASQSDAPATVAASIA